MLHNDSDADEVLSTNGSRRKMTNRQEGYKSVSITAAGVENKNYTYTYNHGQNETRQDERTPSFFWKFLSLNGPPQLVIVAVFITFSVGTIIGIIPVIMTQRFAELSPEYDGEICHHNTVIAQEENNEETMMPTPQICLDASEKAQNGVAYQEVLLSVLTLLTSSMNGSISDLHGRKNMLLCGVMLNALSPLALLYVYLVPTTSPVVFYTVRALHGLINWTAIAVSSLSDVLPPHFRAAGVGLFMSAYWVGICLGPLLPIVLDTLPVIGISCLFHGMAVVSTAWLVPETLSPEAKEAAQRRHDQEQGTERGRTVTTGAGRWMNKLKEILLRPFRELAIINRNMFFRIMSALAFFSGTVGAGDQTLIIYYVNTKLAFSATDTAVMLLLYALGSAISQGFLLQPTNNRIGERMIIILCFCSSTVGNVLYGFANNKRQLYTGICFGALSSMTFPTISAIKANNVAVSEQGRIQGALYSVQAVASGVGPVILRMVHGMAHDTFLGPGIMFVFAAGLEVVAVILACLLPRDKSDSRTAPRQGSSDTLVGEEMESLKQTDRICTNSIT